MTMPPLPKSIGYIYEWVTPFGLHSSLSPQRYNGLPPTRSAPIYTADEMAEYGKACAEAEREACVALCDRLRGLGYRDDGSEQWMGHENAVQACAAAIRARAI
jgi:hypothetical protein